LKGEADQPLGAQDEHACFVEGVSTYSKVEAPIYAPLTLQGVCWARWSHARRGELAACAAPELGAQGGVATTA
jgi:hypothetical protein